MNCHEKSSCINIYCCHGNGENGGNNGDNGGGTVIPGSLQTDWYVNNTGDDVVGDGTQGNPFMTIQHTLDTISMSIVDSKQHTIHVADGTYPETLRIHGLRVHIIGNTDNPGNVRVGGTADSNIVFVDASSTVWFEGLQFDCTVLTSSSYYTLWLSWNSFCWINKCIFNCSNGNVTDISINTNSSCVLTRVRFTGNSRGSLMHSLGGSIIVIREECYVDNATTINYVLALAQAMGDIFLSAPLILTSGTISGQKYLASQFGRISGVSNLPATTVAGSATTGGQVL